MQLVHDVKLIFFFCQSLKITINTIFLLPPLKSQYFHAFETHKVVLYARTKVL